MLRLLLRFRVTLQPEVGEWSPDKESTTALTSRTARDFSLDVYGEYHLVSRTLPCRLMSSTKWIMGHPCSVTAGEQRAAVSADGGAG